MSAKYRTFLTPRATAGGLVELPSAGLKYSWTLDNAGEASLTDVLSRHPAISGHNAAKLDSWSSELLVVRDSGPGATGPMWWGPVRAPSGTADTLRVTINAVDSALWFTRRKYPFDADFSAWDSADAARQMIFQRTIALGPAGDLGFDFDQAKSGMTGPNITKATDRLTLAAAVNQCAQVGVGFDWSVLPTQDANGGYRRLWRIYPGGRGATISRVLSTGRGGMRNFARSPAGDGIATRVYHPVTDTQGNTKYGYAQASADIETKYGIHELDDIEGDAPGNDGDAAARATLGYRTPPVNLLSFSYRVSDAMPLGLVQPGDWLPVSVVDTGWPDYAGTVRVVGVSVEVDDNGEEDVICSLQAPPGGIS